MSAAREGRPCSEGPASPRKASDVAEWVMCPSRERSLRGHPRCADGYFVLPWLPRQAAFSSFPYFLRLIKHFFFFALCFPGPFLLLPLPPSFSFRGKARKGGAAPSVPVNTSALLLNARFQFPGCRLLGPPDRSVSNAKTSPPLRTPVRPRCLLPVGCPPPHHLPVGNSCLKTLNG